MNQVVLVVGSWERWRSLRGRKVAGGDGDGEKERRVVKGMKGDWR